MKTVLIGNTTCHGADRLKEEFEKQGLEFALVSHQNIVLSVTDNVVAFTDSEGRDLLKYDTFIFRGMGDRTEELAVIARYLREHGKVVFEDAFARRGVHIGKLAPVMVDQHISIPDYKLIFSENDVLFSSLTYPCILKGLDGSQGKKVRLVQNETVLRTYLEDKEKFSYPVILQKYFPIRHDYRVIVVNGKALGAMKRYNTDDDFLTIRAGGRREHVELPKEALDIAVHATRLAQLDVAGVDIVEHEGVYYRLEVNMSPQFRVFERITGINVAEKIVDCIVEKYEQNNDAQ